MIVMIRGNEKMRKSEDEYAPFPSFTLHRFTASPLLRFTTSPLHHFSPSPSLPIYL
jgi:hypothetical protein